MNRSRLLSAVRLPNNLFTDYAGTEVGSDLVILQKDTLSQREYTSLERSFVEVGTQADGTTQNEYFEHTAAIVHTRGHVGTDPYGKPARIYLHDGGMEAIAADMKYFLDRNLSEQLDLDLYLRHSPVQEFSPQRMPGQPPQRPRRSRSCPCTTFSASHKRSVHRSGKGKQGARRRTPGSCPFSICHRWNNIPPRPNRLPKRKSGRSRNGRNRNAAGRRKRPHGRNA